MAVSRFYRQMTTDLMVCDARLTCIELKQYRNVAERCIAFLMYLLTIAVGMVLITGCQTKQHAEKLANPVLAQSPAVLPPSPKPTEPVTAEPVLPFQRPEVDKQFGLAQESQAQMEARINFANDRVVQLERQVALMQRQIRQLQEAVFFNRAPGNQSIIGHSTIPGMYEDDLPMGAAGPLSE